MQYVCYVRMYVQLYLSSTYVEVYVYFVYEHERHRHPLYSSYHSSRLNAGVRTVGASHETKQLSNDKSPSFVPPLVSHVSVSLLIGVCCGPPLLLMGIFEDLLPAMQIRHTSYLASTAVFGLALDRDLWGGDPQAASVVLKSLAD